MIPLPFPVLRGSPDGARACPLLKWVEVRLRGAGAQEEREPDGSPASCESPSPPSGRAARVRVSDAFRLPPNCHYDRQGIGCHPRTVRVSFTAPVGTRIARPHAGTRPERRLHGNGKRKPHIASTPAPGVWRKTEPPRHYRKSNFSTVCGQICLRSRAVVYIPGGGDSQEGAKCPLFASRSERACEQPPLCGGS